MYYYFSFNILVTKVISKKINMYIFISNCYYYLYIIISKGISKNMYIIMSVLLFFFCFNILVTKGISKKRNMYTIISNYYFYLYIIISKKINIYIIIFLSSQYFSDERYF